MSMTPDQVKKMEKFFCPDCISQSGEKKVRQSSPRSSPATDHVKVYILCIILMLLALPYGPSLLALFSVFC